MNEWIGVDFDGTLAVYAGDDPRISPPVMPMVERVLGFLKDGYEVRIMTARAVCPKQTEGVQDWCLQHLGVKLPVTDRKDFGMIALYDDRAFGVIKDTGIVDGHLR